MDRVRGEIIRWNLGGGNGGVILTNPADAVIMATTGALSEVGNYLAHVVCGASAAGVWLIQRRNAADTATVNQVPVYTVAAGSGQFILPFRIDTANERIRIEIEGAITGTASASIGIEKVA